MLFATIAGAFAIVAAHAVEIGKPAPAFTAKNVKGETVSLADLKDKVVVLEWLNLECPFTGKHYKSGNIPKLQADYTAKGVVWISICSSNVGKQGYFEPAKMAERATADGSKASQILMDTDGVIGKAYDAKVTPHMFIIGKDGTLRYDGAIDSKPSTDPADIPGAEPLFSTALDAVLAGGEVKNAKNKPYGCGVKY